MFVTISARYSVFTDHSELFLAQWVYILYSMSIDKKLHKDMFFPQWACFYLENFWLFVANLGFYNVIK